MVIISYFLEERALVGVLVRVLEKSSKCDF